MKIFFWAQKDQYGAFSNFFNAPFTLDNREWPTVEHWFQAMKTSSIEEQEKIRAAKNPAIAKRMGRKAPLRMEWEDVKWHVMVEGVWAKFSAHEDLKKLLLSTGDAEIYEDSPFDKIWGTGVKGGVGDGKNLLGKALMNVREKLKVLEKVDEVAAKLGGVL